MVRPAVEPACPVRLDVGCGACGDRLLGHESLAERTNEITAILAAGVPKSRLVKPLIGAVIAVSLLAALNRELFIPAAREQLTHNAQNLLGGQSKGVHPCYDNATNIFISGASCLV